MLARSLELAEILVTGEFSCSSTTFTMTLCSFKLSFIVVIVVITHSTAIFLVMSFKWTLTTGLKVPPTFRPGALLTQ